MFSWFWQWISFIYVYIIYDYSLTIYIDHFLRICIFVFIKYTIIIMAYSIYACIYGQCFLSLLLFRIIILNDKHWSEKRKEIFGNNQCDCQYLFVKLNSMQTINGIMCAVVAAWIQLIPENCNGKMFLLQNLQNKCHDRF